MNANQIHIGEEYAVAPYGKPNGNPFIPNAIRLKAYRTFGEQEYGNKRLTMFVEGFVLDKEGDVVSTTYSKFRVRDVIEEWSEYEDRADQHEVEQAQIERERQERIERERQEYTRRRAEQEERYKLEREEKERQQTILRNKLNFVLNGLEERGFNRNNIKIHSYENVTISVVDLEAWLKSLTKVECMTCHRDLIMIELPT